MSWWSSDDPRRTAGVVAVILLATALVGVGAGYLLGLTTDDSPTTAAELTPSASTSPSPTPSQTSRAPEARAASQIEKGLRSDVGYLVATSRKKDGVHVTLDRVILKTGQDAKDYAKRYHTKKKPDENGVLLINNNPKTRDLVLAKDVQVYGAVKLAGSQQPKPVPLSSLLSVIRSGSQDLLFDLHYDKLGYVVRVQEHDLP